MTWLRRTYLAIVAVNVIGGSVVLVILQLVTFPALGLAWAPIHTAWATGLLTLAALARGTSVRIIKWVRGGRSA